MKGANELLTDLRREIELVAKEARPGFPGGTEPSTADTREGSRRRIIALVQDLDASLARGGELPKAWAPPGLVRVHEDDLGMLLRVKKASQPVAKDFGVQIGGHLSPVPAGRDGAEARTRPGVRHRLPAPRLGRHRRLRQHPRLRLLARVRAPPARQVAMKRKPSAQLSLLDADPWSDRGAVISICQQYRYHLWRRAPEAKNRVLFVMLNPSVADAVDDDPTIGRCLGYAKAWGHDGLDVVNLFAWRATDPKELPKVGDPVGPRNTDYLFQLARECMLVVCAWGDGPAVPSRSEVGKRWAALFEAQQKLALHLVGAPMCFGTTKSGRPLHPLYLKKELQLVPAPRPMGDVLVVGDDGKPTEAFQAYATAILRNGGKP
jgi:hypothetical protein